MSILNELQRDLKNQGWSSDGESQQTNIHRYSSKRT